jgi:hypothetical protein
MLLSREKFEGPNFTLFQGKKREQPLPLRGVAQKIITLRSAKTKREQN